MTILRIMGNASIKEDYLLACSEKNVEYGAHLLVSISISSLRTHPSASTLRIIPTTDAIADAPAHYCSFLTGFVGIPQLSEQAPHLKAFCS